MNTIFLSLIIVLIGFLMNVFYFQLKKREISKKAIKKSIDVISGKVSETFAPLLKFDEHGINPKDARFIGSPIDFVVFKGLHRGEPEELIFIEVKHGNSKLSSVQKKIKQIIENKKVRWIEIKI